MKVLLTGATGYVGSHILYSLVARDIATAVLLRPTSNRRLIEQHLSQIEVRLGSINELPSLRDAMFDATHTIHCAGCTQALRCSKFFDVNHLGARKLVETVNHRRDHNQRLVHICILAAVGPVSWCCGLRRSMALGTTNSFVFSKRWSFNSCRHSAAAGSH